MARTLLQTGIQSAWQAKKERLTMSVTRVSKPKDGEYSKSLHLC